MFSKYSVIDTVEHSKRINPMCESNGKNFENLWQVQMCAFPMRTAFSVSADHDSCSVRIWGTAERRMDQRTIDVIHQRSRD